MSIYHAIKMCLWQKYASISGRASRGEFFAYFLFYIIFFTAWNSLILALMAHFGDINLIDFVMAYIPIVFFPPLIAVSVRRFHDAGKSGWLVLLLFVPVLNLFALALLCLPGTGGPNRFGPVPERVHWT